MASSVFVSSRVRGVICGGGVFEWASPLNAGVVAPLPRFLVEDSSNDT